MHVLLIWAGNSFANEQPDRALSKRKGPVHCFALATPLAIKPHPGFKISAKFRLNFTKFSNFGGGRKKTPKFFNTLIHVLYNSNLIFFYYLYCIFFYLIDM